MRLSLINIKKQNSFKKRYKTKAKNTRLKIGDLGYITNSNFRFEFIYFLVLKKLFKNNLKYKYPSFLYPRLWVYLRSNYPLTRKSKNSRMGKGKGAFLRWSILTSKGTVVFEFLNFSLIRASLILKKWNYSLNRKLIIIKR